METKPIHQSIRASLNSLQCDFSALEPSLSASSQQRLQAAWVAFQNELYRLDEFRLG